MSEVVLSDEKSVTEAKYGWLRQTARVLAILMSLYHMYVAAFGPPEAMLFRAAHLLFAFLLVFILYPTRGGNRVGWRLYDGVLLLLGAFTLTARVIPAICFLLAVLGAFLIILRAV